MNILSISYDHSDGIAVASGSYVLIGWYASVNHMVDGLTGTYPAYCSRAVSGFTPHNSAISSGVEVIVERVGATYHSPLAISSTARTDSNNVPIATSAVHINVARAVQCGIIKIIIAEGIATA